MYDFFDMGCTQDHENHDGSFMHIPNSIYAEKLCGKCEVVEDLGIDLDSVVSVPKCFRRKNP